MVSSSNISAYQALTARIEGLITQAESYADDLSAWNSTVSAAVTSLRNSQSEIGGLEDVATSQERRVDALKRAQST